MRDVGPRAPGIGKGKAASHPFIRLLPLFATGERFAPQARIAAQDDWSESEGPEQTFVLDDEENDIVVRDLADDETDEDEIIEAPLEGQHVALLAADGVNVDDVSALKEGLEAVGAQVSIVSPAESVLAGSGGIPLVASYALADVSSDMFDAICVPGGEDSIQTLERSSMALAMLVEAYRHRKTVALFGESAPLLEFIVFCASSAMPEDGEDIGVIVASGADDGSVLYALVEAMYQHRHWARRVECVFG